MTSARPRTCVEIVTVDPRDEAAFTAWFAVLERSQRHARAGERDELAHEVQATAIEGSGEDPVTRSVLLAARDPRGATLGVAHVFLPQRDNGHLAEVDLHVDPQRRREGVGRALTAAVEDLMRRDGRTTVLLYADEPPADLGRSPGRGAGLALGYQVCQQEARRDIDLPVPASRVQALRAATRPYAGGYRVLSWWDACPEIWLDDRAELSRSMSTDVPKDEMDYREEVWDAGRVRRHEHEELAKQRTFVCAAAVHQASGRLVAYTEMGVSTVRPARAFQWDTLVLAAHRGHRLGTLVKLEALQQLAARSPETTYVSTWNAVENAPMIAVNDALGARVNGGLAVLQKVLT